MKKLLISLLVLLCTGSASVSASKQGWDWARLPDGDVTLNGQTVSYADNTYRQYPVMYYKEIVYVPMTYYDCRYLGLETVWDNDTRTLYIEKKDITCAYREYRWDWKNEKSNVVSICDFNIVVNGKKIDNSKEPYPLLTFRDVTYFPLTWRFAVEEFGWEYSYDHENGLFIESDGNHTESVVLKNIAGSAATDGRYYYYNGDDGDKHVVYRVPVGDTQNPEIIFEYPESGMMRRVNFIESEGDIYFYYTVGSSPVMSRRYVKKINADGTLSDEKPAYFSYSTHGYSEVFAKGNGIEVKAVNPHIQTQTEFSYTINGVTTEVEPYPEPVELGVRRGGQTSYYANIEEYIRIHGDKIYFTAMNVTNSEDSALYVIDTKTGKTEKLLEGVYGFHVYTGWDDESEKDTTMIIYDNNGTLMRYKESSGKSTQIEEKGEEGLVLYAATGDYEISTIQRRLDGIKTVVKNFDCYASGTGSIKGAVFETEAGTGYVLNKDILLVYTMGELPTEDIRMVVPRLFSSADVPESVFIYEDTLIYKLYGEGRIIKVDLN